MLIGQVSTRDAPAQGRHFEVSKICEVSGTLDMSIVNEVQVVGQMPNPPPFAELAVWRLRQLPYLARRRQQPHQCEPLRCSRNEKRIACPKSPPAAVGNGELYSAR